MGRFIVLGLLALPLIEIALLIKVGQTIGLFPTLGLLIGAGILGGVLMRLQGLSVLSQLRSNVNAGRLPARTIADTMMLGLAAVFLILPGFLSDIVALALLLPPVRSWIYGALASRVKVVNTAGYGAANDGYDPRVKGPGTIDLDEDDYRPQ